VSATENQLKMVNQFEGCAVSQIPEPKTSM